MSGVRRVPVCNMFPLRGISDNNVTVPEEESQLFDIVDLLAVTDHYFDVLRIPVIVGRVLALGSDSLRQVVVSQGFASMIEELCG